jgi:hypothetical protein
MSNPPCLGWPDSSESTATAFVNGHLALCRLPSRGTRFPVMSPSREGALPTQLAGVGFHHEISPSSNCVHQALPIVPIDQRLPITKTLHTDKSEWLPDSHEHSSTRCLWSPHFHDKNTNTHRSTRSHKLAPASHYVEKMFIDASMTAQVTPPHPHMPWRARPYHHPTSIAFIPPRAEMQFHGLRK